MTSDIIWSALQQTTVDVVRELIINVLIELPLPHHPTSQIPVELDGIRDGYQRGDGPLNLLHNKEGAQTQQKATCHLRVTK